MKDYDGSGSARRFFVNCEQEFKNLSSVHSWIYAVEACFTGKAAEWVNQQSEIQDILDLEEPDEEDKQRFIDLVRKKYPDRKPPTRKQWMTRLKELKQNNEENESLGQYYRRTHDILRGLGEEDREEEDENDASFLLSYIIENFVDGLHDSQLRCKMRYKYLATSGRYLATEWSLYGAYEAAEQISSTIASKKKALIDLYEEELLKILRTRNMEAVLEFIKKNEPEPYTQKPKSIPVDRIERYRPQQHKKPESTMQKKIAKLTQPYIDEKSSESNVSALGRIPKESQTTSHFDSSVSENMMASPSLPEPNCDPVSNEQVIRCEEPARMVESTEIYASGPSKWPAPVTLPAVDESPLIQEEIQCNLSEISTDIINSGNTESTDEILASTSRKWPVPIMLSATAAVIQSPSISLEKPYQMLENRSVSSPSSSPVSPSRISKPWLTQNWRARLQKPSINESPPVLEQMPCNLPGISASIMDISDTESKKDDILVSGPSSWTAASARKEEVFEPTVTYKAFSKNPPASYFEDTEISPAVDMPSLEDLSNQNGPAIGAFDSDTGTDAFSKNPLIQPTEDSETLEKNSVYTYEIPALPALPAFDLSIDIDFEAYTTVSEVTYSSTEPHVTPLISSVTLQAAEATSGYGREQSSTCSADYATTNYGREQSSTCSAIYATSSYEREQSSTCSVEDHTTSCYEGEQNTRSVDTTSDVTTKPDDITSTKFMIAASTVTEFTVTKPVVHHALLAYYLTWIQHTTLPFCMIMWTLYEYITLWNLASDYKARPKVKIKRLLEPKHIETRSQQNVAGIFAEFTYEMTTFSNASLRINTSGISAVFAYKMALFSSGLQGLETFDFKVLEPAYGFGFRACKMGTFDIMQLRRGQSPTSTIFRHSPISVLRIPLFHAHNVVCLAYYSVSRLLCVWGSMLHAWN